MGSWQASTNTLQQVLCIPQSQQGSSALLTLSPVCQLQNSFLPLQGLETVDPGSDYTYDVINLLIAP